ncbi:MAG: sensor histidine kinase [Butyricicoccus sp.]
MKRLSIRLRVTLWFTALMTILACLVLVFLYLAGHYTVRSMMQERLVNIVENTLDKIEYDDGELELDDDMDFFVSGVYRSIYDAEGWLLYGRIPADYSGVQAFSDGTLQRYDDGDDSWYLYDIQYEVAGYGTVWVRGILSAESANSAFSSLFTLARVALPILVLLAALGGYFLIHRAFLPVRHITASAEQISSGSDLSRRIALGEGRDEIYQLAATVDRMLDRLEDSFAREKQFTSDASHELRTPLSVILSQCDYSLSRAQTEEEYVQALETIQEQGRKMSALISQLLTLARADRGQDKLLLETIDLSHLTEIVAMQTEETAQEKGITVYTDVAPNLLIQGDETMLMRLLLNLMENGVKYGRPGGHLWVTLDAQGEQIRGTIRDDGIGISEEDLPRIWDRFYQADPSRSSTVGGVGLGLPMVQYIVRAHGGTITAESQLGQGSCFTFFLPVQRDEKN